MNENTLNTLFKLLGTYKVEVPIVQRDYAQGRRDEHTKMVRYNLLSDMKSAILHETQPLDLNFVYGKTEKEKFIPIDGQQRLTTLFLLHLYAFHKDDSKTDLLRKFTYETRISSRDFLEQLTDKRCAVFSSDLSPSKEIEDSEWFVSGWKYDPTIQSALSMLDDIKTTFYNIKNLAEILSNHEFEPIVFKFLEMKDLGMEDSLYIKLNARGKPLTSFENFKARLIARLQKLHLPFADKFELYFDTKWTDLFWSHNSEKFDQTYLTYFGVLLMNNGICQSDTDTNWSNALDYEKIEARIFESVFYTLNFLCNNPDSDSCKIIFNVLDKLTYPNRVMFHVMSTYLFMSKGTDTGSLWQWIRILRNLTMNTTIDKTENYRPAIDGINKLSENWDGLLDYFGTHGNVSGFSGEQIAEEQAKARLILKDTEFANAIYKAEAHSYFCGQVRSALYLSMDSNEQYDKDIFVQYWDKISSMFDETKPTHEHLLRRAMLTFGDYTLPVGEYKTFCVDDPNEGASTPSMKRLFSNHGDIVKSLLDELCPGDNIKNKLDGIVSGVNVSKNDWRYCFIKFPELFGWMSGSHLRIRDVSGEVLIVTNKSSNGYNSGVFLGALFFSLKQHDIESRLDGDLGTWAERFLLVKEHKVKYKNGKFSIKDKDEKPVFQTDTDDPIEEATQFFIMQPENASSEKYLGVINSTAQT
jgi:hypothetical protein